jgi:hypothetical protein
MVDRLWRVGGRCASMRRSVGTAHTIMKSETGRGRRRPHATNALLKRVCIALPCLAFAYSPSIADAINLVQNGDFATGDFTDWTLFTTSSNGSLGFAPVPDVISFDVTGSGATNAARFQVGQVALNAGVPEGGGLMQNVLTGTGTFNFTIRIRSPGTD